MHATRVPPQHRGGRVRKVRQRFDPRHVERCGNWRPLFAIAEILLADLKQKFTGDRIFSKRTWSNCGHKSKSDSGRKCVAEKRSPNAGSHANFTHLKSFRVIFALALNIKSDLL